MSELISIEAVASKIFFIRSVKVMLDKDLAELYGVDYLFMLAKIS